MDEQRPGDGGPANTPPFPRLVHGPEDAPLSDAGATSNPNAIPGPAEGGATLGGIPTDAADEGLAGFGRDFNEDFGDVFREEEDLDPSASRERVRDFTDRPAGRLRSRAASGVSRGFGMIADRLDEVADRLDQLAEEQLQGEGPRARAADVVQTTGGWVQGVADYFRTTDLDAIQRDLERQVREKPLQSLLIALGAGWIAGRIMR